MIFGGIKSVGWKIMKQFLKNVCDRRDEGVPTLLQESRKFNNAKRSRAGMRISYIKIGDDNGVLF